MVQTDAIVNAACAAFIADGRIEVGELARATGVNRSTIYRRWGGRDGLLAEVIWTVTAPTIDAAYRRTPGVGAERIAATMGEFADIVNRAPYFRAFLEREPERALRVMSTRDGGVQPRIVTRIEELLRGEVDAGNLVPPLPLEDLALILVRITETFVYSDVITGGKPDSIKVRQACAALLGVAVPTTQSATPTQPAAQ